MTKSHPECLIRKEAQQKHHKHEQGPSMNIMIVQIIILVHGTRAWTTKQQLANFEGAFYRFYAIRPQSAIPEHREDSSKSTPFSPLTLPIPHDDSGSEQVDPLLTLYKRIKSHSTKVSSTTH